MKPGWLYEERDAHLLGLMRVAVACLLLLFTLKLARQLVTHGYFGDVFHLPLLPEAWVPSRAVYTAMLALAASLCVLSALGVWPRLALLAAALLHFYAFFCDRLQYHNNRYALLLLTCLIALSPCDRSFLGWRRLRALPPLGPEARRAPRLFAHAIGAQLSLVYLASSLGKAFDADWRGGTVMRLRFAEGHALLSRHLPSALADVLTEPWFAHVASLAAIGSELLIAVGPWLAPSRPIALWLGVVFHVGIEVSANVELFSYTMLCGYVAFATPELCERRLSVPVGAAGRRLAWAVSKLDWLARFEVVTAPRAGSLLVTDRSGHSHAGLAGWRELTRGLPLLFPLWLPLWLLSWRPNRAPRSVTL